MGTPPATTPSRSPTHARLGVLGFACGLSLITYLDRICISRSAEDIQASLGFDENSMGWVFSAFTVGYLLFEIPGGRMGDVWGSRRVLTRIVLCWSAFTALTGCVWAFTPLDSGVRLTLGGWQVPLLLDAFGLMLLVRFLFGVGEAGAYPNLARVTRDWFPYGERGRAQGGIWMFARLGGAVAPFVIGRLTAALGWRQAFWVLGLLGAGWAVLFWHWFRDRPEGHPACNEAERDLIRGEPEFVAPAEGHSWPGVSRLASSASIWALGWASFWVCFGWWFYPTWQPKYLKDVHGFAYASTYSELLTGLPFLCGAAGALLGGRLSDWLVPRLGRRWGRSSIGLVGFTAAGACVLATGFATSWWEAVLLLCLAFFVNDLAVPIMWTVSADVGGRHAGTVAGLMNMVGGFGAVLSPVLIPRVLGWLPDDYSAPERWRSIFAGLAGAWFLAAAAWPFVDASKPLEE